jgi:hypothetical protein
MNNRALTEKFGDISTPLIADDRIKGLSASICATKVVRLKNREGAVAPDNDSYRC